MGSDNGLIIIDIGSCIGEFIDDCIRDYGDAIKQIFAFEPLEVNYNYLVSKYADRKHIKPINSAVSNVDGKAKFYYNLHDGKYSYVGNSGCSLCSQKSDVVGMGCEVPVIRLSSFAKNIAHIDRIDILKVDAECSEYDIFEDILDNNMVEMIGKIFFEDHASPKNAWLRERRSEVMVRMQATGIFSRMYKETDLNVYTNLQEIIDRNAL